MRIFDDCTVVSFDTETTGLDPQQDRIIQIGLTIYHNRNPGPRYNIIVRSEVPISEEARKKHKITDEMVMAGQPAHEVFPKVAQLLLVSKGPDGVVPVLPIAYNKSFDISFVSAEFRRQGLPELDPARVLDVLVLARAGFPGRSHKLTAMCEMLDVPVSGQAHNACVDAAATAELLFKLEGYPPLSTEPLRSVHLDGLLDWASGEGARQEAEVQHALQEQATALLDLEQALFEHPPDLTAARAAADRYRFISGKSAGKSLAEVPADLLFWMKDSSDEKRSRAALLELQRRKEAQELFTPNDALIPLSEIQGPQEK